MALDPNAKFIVSATTRKGIAGDLNDFLGLLDKPEQFDDGDDRLTDEICTQYAHDIGCCDGESEDQIADQAYAIQSKLIESFGISTDD